jgi:hypothetical protein
VASYELLAIWKRFQIICLAHPPQPGRPPPRQKLSHSWEPVKGRRIVDQDIVADGLQSLLRLPTLSLRIPDLGSMVFGQSGRWPLQTAKEKRTRDLQPGEIAKAS